MRGRLGCERSVAAEGLVALGLSGELDIETVPIFEAAMQGVLADAPATAVLELHGGRAALQVASQARPLPPVLLEPDKSPRVVRRPQQLALFAAR